MPSERDHLAAGAGRSALLLMTFGLPTVVLTTSYVWLALDHGTPRLWNVVVHESGRYTLRETILYYGHFLREVPVVTAYVLFLLGSSGAVRRDRSGPPPIPGDAPARRTTGVGWAVPDRLRRGVGWLALLLLGAVVGEALFRTAVLHGWGSVFLDLVQYRTRDDLVGFGTHWHYHWLSTVWFGAAAGVVTRWVDALRGHVVLEPHRPWLVVAWAYVLILTLVFGLTDDVFLDVRYAGHQAREMLTHGPMLLLPGLGLVALAARGRRGGRAGRWRLPRWSTGVLAALALVLPLLTASVALAGDVMEQGQSRLGLSAMVAAHYFEHSLDYVMSGLLLVACLALVNLRTLPRATPTPPSREERDHEPL